MKKNLILLCAPALLLAGCGGNPGTSAYVQEPSGAKASDATTIAAATKKLSENLGKKKAIGLDLENSGSLSASLTFAQSEELAGLSGKTYGVNLSEEAKGSLGIASLDGTAKGSASASAHLKADMTIPSISFDDSMKMAVKDEKIAIDTNLSAKGYLEEGVLYGDLTGLKSGLQEIQGVLDKLGTGAQLPEGLDGKYKTALPADAVTTVKELPELLTTYSNAIASLLENFDALVESVEDPTIKAILQGLEFKTFDGGLYGIELNADLKSIIKLLPIGDTTTKEILNKLAEVISAKANAILVFSENEIKSFGVQASADAKDLKLDSLLGEEIASSVPIEKINVSLDLGAKLSFSYDDAVKVESVTDKDSYEQQGTLPQIF